MVASSKLICMISNKLKEYSARNIVVDPVMVATNGAKLICDEAIETLRKELLPMATVLTPNIPEAEVLSRMKIYTERDMEDSARKIFEEFGSAVLLKRRHDLNDANDLLWNEKGPEWFRGKKVENPNTHGTGCTLSSAIASNLALGRTLSDSVKRAKDFVSGALSSMLDLGKWKRADEPHVFPLEFLSFPYDLEMGYSPFGDALRASGEP